MSRRTHSSIPSWASIRKEGDGKKGHSKRTNVNQEGLTLEQEEAYLRTRAYQSIASMIDNAVEMTLKEKLSKVVTSLQTFFSNHDVSSLRCNQPNRVAIHDHIGTNGNLSSYPSDPYQIPVAILNGPSSILDRQEIMGFLVDTFRTQKDVDTSPAICRISNLGQAVAGRNDCAPLLHEILMQCIHQESEPIAFYKLLKRQDALLKWARKTNEFDSIVVFLELVERMPALQGFLHHLSELRAIHGLPIYIVLFSPSQCLPLRSSTQGPSGLSLAFFSLLPSDEWMALVWSIVSNELWVSPSTMRSIRASFSNQHQSLVKSILMLKAAVAHALLQPGSFAIATHSCPQFVKQELDRISWFRIDPQAKALFDSAVQFQETLEQAVEIRNKREEQRILGQVLHRMLNTKQSFNAMAIMDEACWGIFHDNGHFIKSELAECTTKELLKRIGLAMDGLNHDLTISTKLDNYIDRFENMTIFLHNEFKEEESVSKHALLDLEILIHDICQQVALLRKELQSGLPFNGDVRTTDAILPELRAVVATQLLSPDQISADSLLESATQLYDLMKDSIAISRNDLFVLFRENYGIERDNEELWPLFCLGIYNLIHLGFIREKRASGKFDSIYEKVAVVWCSGD